MEFGENWSKHAFLLLFTIRQLLAQALLTEGKTLFAFSNELYARWLTKQSVKSIKHILGAIVASYTSARIARAPFASGNQSLNLPLHRHLLAHKSSVNCPANNKIIFLLSLLSMR